MGEKKPPRHYKEWTDKLNDIAKAIAGVTSALETDAKKQDAKARQELAESTQSKGIEKRAVDAAVNGNRIQIALLVVTAIAGGFAYGAYIETRRQADEAKRQADIAQEQLSDARRPVILVRSGRPTQDPQKSPETIPTRETDGYIVWNIHWLNYGPFPALKAVGTGNVLHGPNAETQIDGYFAELDRSGKPIGVGSIISPDKDKANYWASLPSMEPVTQETFDAVMRFDFFLVAVGRVRYEDIAGNVYETDFCFRRLANANIANCRAHNELRRVSKSIDRNGAK